MKNLVFAFLIAILTVSCKKSDEFRTNSQSSDSDSIVLNDPKNNLNIQTKSFVEIDSSGILMFPLEMSEAKRTRDMSYKDIPNGNYWNIIFLNSKTNEYHLLSQQKMLIYDYNYDEYQEERGISTSRDIPYIFYRIRSDDFNQDKLLNQQDPLYLYVSDLFGKNFRQISPKDQHLINWSYIKSSNKILMNVQKDSGKNGEFDSYDEINTYELTLGQDENPREIFSQKFKNELKILFDRDWKRIDKDE